MSVVLLGGTSIFLQMLSASRTARVGFAIDGVAMLETDARYAGYSATAAGNVYEEIRRRVAAIPGVQIRRAHPRPADADDRRARGRRRCHGDGRTDSVSGAARVAGAIWAGPGYFDMLRIPILFGRALDERDRRDTPRVAVISETMARQILRGRQRAPARSDAVSGSNGTRTRTPGSRSSAWRATPGRPI